MALPADVIEDRFRAAQLRAAVTIPYEDQLTTMLHSGTYALEALQRPTRLAVKRFGLAIAARLV